eukprot:5762927-Alexandrium_andersonii.AAC.1
MLRTLQLGAVLEQVRVFWFITRQSLGQVVASRAELGLWLDLGRARRRGRCPVGCSLALQMREVDLRVFAGTTFAIQPGTLLPLAHGGQSQRVCAYRFAIAVHGVTRRRRRAGRADMLAFMLVLPS